MSCCNPKMLPWKRKVYKVNSSKASPNQESGANNNSPKTTRQVNPIPPFSNPQQRDADIVYTPTTQAVSEPESNKIENIVVHSVEQNGNATRVHQNNIHDAVEEIEVKSDVKDDNQSEHIEMVPNGTGTIIGSIQEEQVNKHKTEVTEYVTYHITENKSQEKINDGFEKNGENIPEQNFDNDEQESGSSKVSSTGENSTHIVETTSDYTGSEETGENAEDEAERLSTDESDVQRRGGVRGETIDMDHEIVKYPKKKEEEEVIKKALMSNNFLANVLKEKELQAIIEAMSPRDVKAQEIIIHQGDNGDDMFVSDLGRYEIFLQDTLFDTFTDNRVFGELAILYNNPRLATIKATTSGRVWCLHRNDYQQIMVKNAQAEEQEILSFLGNVPEVNKATTQQLIKISSLLKTEFFTTDMVIIKQGDKGDEFYIIKAGTVTVSIEGKGRVATMSRGQFFGERALLTDDYRQATVTADSPGVECLILSRQDFTDNLGKSLKDWLEQDETAKKPKEYEKVVSEYDYLELSHLKRVKTLGIGGFGRVELVQSKENPKLVFALKYLKKYEMLKNEHRQHAFNEKNIQISCNSNFIVRLYKTYQDKKYLYYLMESCLGGDLWSLLQKQRGRCFTDQHAKFLAACILEALSYLHERDYIYRDLKPENMLIDTLGYVKLTDFGFAKHLVDGAKTFTFAGTPEYVAPEIIYNQGHTKGVDYWAFGVFIFELLVGKTPFRHSDPTHMKTYGLILKGIDNVVFPAKVSKNAQQIIKKLCKSKPTDRLGCQRNGVQDIRNHKWFLDFNWEKLRSRKIKSSFVPKLDSVIDTKNFEDFREDKDTPPEVDSTLWEGF